MIFSTKYKYVISNLGWIDKGNLWIYSLDKNSIETKHLSDSQYLTLVNGKNDYFSIGHNFNDSKFELTVHHFSKPSKILCRLLYTEKQSLVEGDKSLLKNISQYHISYLNINNNFDFHLFKISNNKLHLSDENLKWYYEGNFDFDYQGLIGVTEFENELIFCVQRDGSLYRYDLKSQKIVERISLAGGYGNPKIVFCNDNSELWVDDYNTLLRLDTKNWKIKVAKKLQLTNEFIGSYSISGELVIVPRPFSSDILILDRKLDIIEMIKVGSQPFEAVLIDKYIISRELKTGTLLLNEVDIPQISYEKEKRISILTKLYKWLLAK